MKLAAGFGTICLAIYLILTGLAQLAGFAFQGMAMLLGVLAILAGVLLLVGK